MKPSPSILAKKKLKSHIEKYGKDHDFVINESIVLYWFHVINKAAFRNKLPIPKWEFRKMRGSWGECREDSFKDGVCTCVIAFSTDINSRDLMIGTIAHELVHLYTATFENKMSHSGSFLKWKRYFKKHLKISL